MAKEDGNSAINSVLIVIAVVGSMLAPHLGTAAKPAEGRGRVHALPETREPEGLLTVALPLDATREPRDRYAAFHRSFEALLARTTGQFLQKAAASAPQATILPLLVSVPDPRQSHMALYYDQALVALRQAAETEGFLADRFDLKWQFEGHDDSSQNGKHAEASENFEPGLMLFRRASGEILLAILVTESPVVGASLPQLDLALKLADEVAPKDPLRIIGPFFSGSAHSFVQAIEARRQAPEAKGAVFQVGLGQTEAPSERFCVLTGSATERSVDEAFGPIARDTVFGRTIPTDDQLLSQLVWPVAGAQQGDSQPLEQGRVAEISELGTGYGSGSGGAARKFRFPIHISDVRAERERSDNAAEAELFPTLRRTLGLRYNPLEERESDVPATLSSLTAYDDDLTLAQQMTGICTNHFRYLLVRASDPMDVVFLAKEARKYCPELVFLVLDYDELFVHPDLGSTFSGAFMAAPFAPFRTQAFVAGLPPFPFPNSLSQGFFNAAVVQIGRLTREGEAAARAHMVGYRCLHNGECGWDVYLSQLASSQIWPIKAASAPALDEFRRLEASGNARAKGCQGGATLVAHAPTEVPKPGTPATGKAQLFAWPALFAAAAHLFARFKRRGIFRECAHPWNALREQRFFVANLALLLLVALECLPFVFANWGGAAPAPPLASPTWMIARLGLAAVILLFAYSVTSGLSACKPLLRWRLPARKLAPWQTRLGGALAVTGCLVLTVCIARWEIWRRPFWSRAASAPELPSPAELCSLRLLDPLAMSPATPLACIVLGVYVWALYALCRVERLDRFPTRMPLVRANGSVNPVWRSLSTTWAELSKPWSETRYLRGIGLLLVFVSWRFYRRIHPTFELEGFDTAFKVGFLLLGLYVAAELVRFLTLSGLLLEWLRDLAAEPMINAYDRISRKMAGSFGLQLRARVPAPQELQVSVLTAVALARIAGELPTLRKRADELDRAAQRIARSTELLVAGERSLAERRAHRAFFGCAAVLHSMLTEIWKERANAPLVKQVAAEFTSAQLLPGGAYQATPTPLLFMSALPHELYLWSRMAEDFVAVRFSTFIYQALHELRHTLTFALLGALLLVSSVVSYPFQPAHFLSLCGWMVVVAVVLAALIRMLALERNELLSRLGGTKPDSVEWNAAFVRQVVLYVGLPLLAAIVGIFPELGDWLVARLSSVARVIPNGN